MKKVIEILRKNRKMLCALSAAVIMFGLCFGYTVIMSRTQESGRAAIRASAEEAALTAETSRPIYPSENLFDISKQIEKEGLEVSGTKISVTDAYAFGSGNYFKTLFPRVTAGTYTFSAEITSTVPLTGASARLWLLNGPELLPSNRLGYVTSTITLTAEDLERPLYFYGVKSGVVTWDKLCCNKGDTAYPWLPNLDSVRQDGYEAGEQAGHETGKQEGYDEGYKDASDTLNLGVLYGATASGKFSYTNGQTVTLANGKPDFSYNGLNFNSIWGKYYDYNGDSENTLETAEMTLNFKTSFQYDGFPLYFLGDSDVMSATFISTANKRYNANIEKYNDTAIGADYALIKIRDNEKEESIEIKSLTIYFGRAIDTLYNANVLSLSGGFLNGYDNGYNDGFSSGHTNGVLDGRKEGYNSGYNQGYIVGKNDGLSLADNSSMYAVIGAIFDAPVNVVKDFLSFEILGVNMLGFFSGILTLLLIAKLIRLFI